MFALSECVKFACRPRTTTCPVASPDGAPLVHDPEPWGRSFTQFRPIGHSRLVVISWNICGVLMFATCWPSVSGRNGFVARPELVIDSPLDAVPTMRNRSRHPVRVSWRACCLLAAVAFSFVLLGTESVAWANRIAAPMCTPDAQSMPAPLQRTPTSDAEIQRVPPCPSVETAGWDILPQTPDIPNDWNLPASDPIWLTPELPMVVPARLLDAFVLNRIPNSNRVGYANGVFRPPR